LGDLPRAEEALLKAIEAAPENDLARKAKFNIAWAYKSKGDYDKSLEYFESLARESRGTVFEVAGKYQIADALYKKGDFEKARDEYVQISTQYMKAETADLALFQAGYISFYNLNDPEAAAKYTTELSERFSDTIISNHMLDTTSFDMATDFRNTGYDLLDKKDYTSAIDSFKKAVELAPRDGVSYSGMGIGYYRLNDKKASLEMARKAVDVGLDNKVASANALFLYIQNGRVEEAIMIGRTALVKVKGKLPQFYYNLGCAYDMKQRFNTAAVYYRRALKLNPKFTAAHNNLGCDYWKTGNYISAMDEFKTAVALEPDYVPPRLNLGICYFYLSRPEEALNEFRNVLGLDPANKTAKEFLQKTENALGIK
jgi:tetratricopeptide (TPR) repeat protein